MPHRLLIRHCLVHSAPYDKPDRPTRLPRRLNEIEGAEYASWAQLAGPSDTGKTASD
jgi:hypothetical protein